MRRLTFLHVSLSAVFCLCALAGEAHGQCNADEVLVGEDAKFWYCAGVPTGNEVTRAAAKLDTLRPEWFGEEWRYRKAVIDVAGCLAKQPGTPYLWSGKYSFPRECTDRLGAGLDCSGLIAYSNQFAACFVNRFYKAAFDALQGLHDRNAADQAEYFKKYKAWNGPNDSPVPGDAVFFKDTYKGCKGICHVAIFLGDASDGRRLIIHASSTKGVVITKMPEQWRSKIVGYGNVSRLYLNISGKQ
ncbi:MAG TPA: NlpC/P60 family protein [Pyrinomonadaceae bacterium]|jgi:cell wall-associated NlpC family hydrolase|nr:NlpC/P60 family protein [Pyrinomonadaceae bacterium]